MIDIIEMTKEHIDEVMIVENLSFSVPWSREALIEEINNNKFAYYYVAKYNGALVGYGGMWKVFEEGHIMNIAVHPEYRGTGIGSRILVYMIEEAKRISIEKMTLEVRKGNTVAQALYSKYGFESAGIRKAYYADNGEDAIIMWKFEI